MARERIGWTLRQLGDAVGCSPSTVSHWESGRHEPSYRQVLLIAQLTGQQMPGTVAADVAKAVNADAAAAAAGKGPAEVQRMVLADFADLQLEDQVLLAGLVHSWAQQTRLMRQTLMEKITPPKKRRPDKDAAG